ncbi:RusA family crossover junction endodeoxyribonuclease [Brevundimonas sp. BAL450]|uniref:RusA family crossover junction endodeoxyribonuclease n=1 Tax=Brevundimonas sp. BAL450 TaxID=1708162 RepID=UPI0018CB8D00|nr:RusA family crossover junction endodeoxyribonuclease [Brevundimonas sp. BAL450]MBG7616496.1 RusA family crossover junction endodeoxyribonuclease [Brevundimonas sp. BAL450]
MPRVICEFTYDAPAVGKARPKFARIGGNVRTYTPKKTADYETAIGYAAKAAMLRSGEPLAVEEAVVVDILVERAPLKSWSRKKAAAMLGTPITGKPDIDNLAKAILDGMNGIAFLDDAQVAGLVFWRRWSAVDRITVKVTAIEADEGREAA